MDNPNPDKKVSSADELNVRDTVHTRPATPEEVAYRDGYTEAQLREQNRQMRASQQVRSDNTSAGVVIGILLASLVGIIVGAFFWISQRDEVFVPVLEPQPEEPEVTNEAEEPNVIERNTTVIERTVDRVQETVPAEPPNVQITLPEAENESAPAQETAPASESGTSEAAPAPEDSSSAQ